MLYSIGIPLGYHTLPICQEVIWNCSTHAKMTKRHRPDVVVRPHLEVRILDQMRFLSHASPTNEDRQKTKSRKRNTQGDQRRGIY